MNLRQTWTLDPERFPLHKVRELVAYLHDHDQHYVVMVDPPISVDDPVSYDKLIRSESYFRNNDGSVFLAGMWSGATAFVDWFHPNAQDYWSGQIQSFFDAQTGVDVDAIWIDMNEVHLPAKYRHKVLLTLVFVFCSLLTFAHIPARTQLPGPRMLVCPLHRHHCENRGLDCPISQMTFSLQVHRALADVKLVVNTLGLLVEIS